MPAGIRDKETSTGKQAAIEEGVQALDPQIAEEDPLQRSRCIRWSPELLAVGQPQERNNTSPPMLHVDVHRQRKIHLPLLSKGLKSQSPQNDGHDHISPRAGHFAKKAV